MASRYILIKASFSIVGTELDGDTLRFQTDASALVETLGPAGQAPCWSHDGTRISVRFEAIAASETHFQGARQQVAGRSGDAGHTARRRLQLGVDEPLFLDPPLLAASVAAQLLAQGLAYPPSTPPCRRI
jgi:hypothetical protein